MGLVAQAFALDAWLIRRRHDTISSCVRSLALLQVLYGGIGLHLARRERWGRYDPLSRGGDWYRAQTLRRRTLIAEGVLPRGPLG